VKWVEVVEVAAAAVADVVVVLAVAADAGRAGWAVLRPPGLAVAVSALTAGTLSRTPSVSPVTTRSAPSAAHR
jgi:hypothetical protein